MTCTLTTVSSVYYTFLFTGEHLFLFNRIDFISIIYEMLIKYKLNIGNQSILRKLRKIDPSTAEEDETSANFWEPTECSNQH